MFSARARSPTCHSPSPTHSLTPPLPMGSPFRNHPQLTTNSSLPPTSLLYGSVPHLPSYLLPPTPSTKKEQLQITQQHRISSHHYSKWGLLGPNYLQEGGLLVSLVLTAEKQADA
ncbi:hypothetical protein Pcinc_020875 [Petrolisthes cinctipes]|uniref:Uncharacterized protein n=1 Tax=Petrolisthes cinctipes TaxID=88211 RepID=A0AAE1F5Q4_PETCI|nr:hypothetical protein Pcinc_027134 [Petrolisthes cinctipes]KAK3874166.1 hypothetical protein Pcinc_020875 [Petrolisthes cinctipes]